MPYDPVRDAPTPHRYPYFVVAVRPDLVLHDGPDGDEGFVTLTAYLAGPFGTFDEAERAFGQCGCVDGDQLAIYSTREHSLLFADPL